jgi:hypothetical protein
MISRSEDMIKEITRNYPSGYLAIVVLPALLIANGWWFYNAVNSQSVYQIIGSVVVGLVLIVCLLGFFMVHPNQARVMTLFGTYVGSARDTGLAPGIPVCVGPILSMPKRLCRCGYEILTVIRSRSMTVLETP